MKLEKSSILEIAEKMIRMQTTADQPVELQRIVKFVEDFFVNNKHVHVEKFESKGKPSIVISTEKTLKPDILMIGHLDVVPAEAELFEPRYQDGKLFARGACDMKSECAMMMELLDELSQTEKSPSLALMLTTDEEVGGFNGVNYLVNEIGYRANVALIPDGGTSPEHILLANKGVLLLRLTAKGKTAHGSRPWLGENAITKLFKAFQMIKEHFPDPVEEGDWIASCNIGYIEGGHAANTIPDHAICDLDIRFTETHTADELLSMIKQWVPEVLVEKKVSGKPIKMDKEHEYIKLYEEELKQGLQKDLDCGTSCGTNDGRFLMEHGVPLIISRPISGDQHSPDEWVDVESLKNFKELYKNYILRLSGTF